MKRRARLVSLLITAVMLLATFSPLMTVAESPITLRMIESLTSPTRTELLRRQLDAFEEANPGIKVELISPPLSDADRKIAQMLMNQQPLDVLEVRDLTAAQLSNNKWIFDMVDYINAWDAYEGLSDIAKHDISAVSGASLLVPYGFYQRSLYYNTKHFEAVGLEPPKTLGELYEYGKKLTDPSINRFGYSFRGAAGGHWYLDMFIQANLGDKVSEECAYYTKDNQTIFGQPEALETLNYYLAQYKDISAPDSLNWSYPEMVEAFVSGVTSMLIQDPEVIATCEARMEKGTWTTAPLPVGDETGISYGPMGYAGWGMSSYSEHKDEAWKLISYLCSPEVNAAFCKENSLLPIHAAASEDPFYAGEAYAAYTTMSQDINTWRSAVPPYDYEGWGEFNSYADADIQKVLTGSLTPEDMLAKWDKYWLEQVKK